MTTDILFQTLKAKQGEVGLITLNRPKNLNALNQTMCITMYEQLKKWADDKAIKAVIITGNGERAFCAGGDIRYFYDMQHDRMHLPEFFQHEYRLDHFVFHYPKPYIALMHGITMGGGAGIGINGGYRIVAENLLFAMPETSIGFHPDVGGGYFLSRCPDKLGFYLGLTGARINAADAKFLGLIDAVIPQEKFADLIDTITQADLDKNLKENLNKIIQLYAVKPVASILQSNHTILRQCFAENTIEQIIGALQALKEEWANGIAEEMLTKSPISLKVTLRKLQESHFLNFDDCIKMDYRLTYAFIQHYDFFEGIRAAIIDKDRKPKWQPATLAEVSAKELDGYFSTPAFLDLK